MVAVPAVVYRAETDVLLTGEGAVLEMTVAVVVAAAAMMAGATVVANTNSMRLKITIKILLTTAINLKNQTRYRSLAAVILAPH